MLMNNLDPEVAERPDDLVVYGGTGRAARSWAAFDAIVRSLRASGRRRDAARAVGQAGRRLSHPRVGAARPHRQLAPRSRVGDLGGVPPPRGDGSDDVRPDDSRLVDLHRQPGHRPGHLRVLRRDRAAPLRWIARRDDHAHRRPRRHGRCPAARGDHERGRRARASRSTRTASSAGSRPGTSTSAPTTWTTRSPAASAPRIRAAPAERRPVRQRRRRPARAPRSRGFAADVVTDQTSAHDPLVGYVPNTLTLDEAERMRRDDPDEYVRRARAAIAAHCFAMVGFKEAGAEVFDYGNSLRAEARLGGFERAFDYPGFVPAYIRPLFCEGKGPFRWVALSGDPEDIAATDRAVLEEFRRDEPLVALDPARGRADRLPGATGADLLARLRRAGAARAALQRDGPLRRAEGSDRDRPRPPRLGLGRLAVPRDRGHGRRLRRDRRLAAPERARQHRLGRHPGCRSTTAAVSGSGARSTPAWSASRTDRTSPRRSSSAS